MARSCRVQVVPVGPIKEQLKPLNEGELGLMRDWLDTCHPRNKVCVVKDGDSVKAWGAFIGYSQEPWISVYVRQDARQRGLGLAVARKLLRLAPKRLLSRTRVRAYPGGLYLYRKAASLEKWKVTDVDCISRDELVLHRS